MNIIKTTRVILALNHATMIQDLDILEQHGFRPVLCLNGVYKGQSEHSYMIEINDLPELYKLEALLNKYLQESYLYINQDNRASLVYLRTQRRHYLGIWRQVDKVQALNSESYTYDYNNERYYLA
jgi:hypothetical protein